MAKKPAAQDGGQAVTNDATITPADWQAASGDLTGLWSDPSHWSGASVPGAGNDVDIGTGLTATAAWTVTAANEVANSVTVDMGPLGTLAATGTMDVATGLTLDSGTLLAGAGSRIDAAVSLVGAGGSLVVDGGTVSAGTTAELDGTTAVVRNGGTLAGATLYLAQFGVSELAVQAGVVSLTGALQIGLDGSRETPLTAGVGALLVTGGGRVDAGSLSVANGSTIAVDSVSAIDIGGAASVGGAIAIAAGATATFGSAGISADIVDNGTLDALRDPTAAVPGSGPTISGALTGTGVVHVGSGFTLELGSASAFTGSITVERGGELKLDAGDAAGAAISFAGGAVDIAVQTFAPGLTPTYDTASGLLTVGGSTLDVGTGLSAGQFALKSDGHGGTLVTEAPCYVAGTRILAEHGEARVEALRPGDRVRTAEGRLAPVRWVGRMHVDLARHPAPHHAAPIRIVAGAFADGVPTRDLLVSPDHALLAEGVLIPARRLVNGATIRSEHGLASVTYVHVELDRHDLLLAEGLAAESYLDTGNRGSFAGSTGTRPLHPDFTADHEAASVRAFAEHACRRLVIHGDLVTAAHAALLARAEAVGHALTRDPALTIDSDVAGMSAEPDGSQGMRLFLPAAAQTVRVRSRSFVPEALNPACGDGRRLGVALAVRLNGRPMPASGFGPGWHAHEPRAAWRWTDGDAILTLPPRRRQAVLTLHLLEAGARYWTDQAPASTRAAEDRTLKGLSRLFSLMA